MEIQRWEDSRRRREEERRSERRKNEKQEDAGARKGAKVEIHYGFPMVCGSGGWKSSVLFCWCQALSVSSARQDRKVESRFRIGDHNSPTQTPLNRIRNRNDLEKKGRLTLSENANVSHSIQLKGMNLVSTCREQAGVVPKARPGIFKCLKRPVVSRSTTSSICWLCQNIISTDNTASERAK